VSPQRNTPAPQHRPCQRCPYISSLSFVSDRARAALDPRLELVTLTGVNRDARPRVPEPSTTRPSSPHVPRCPPDFRGAHAGDALQSRGVASSPLSGEWSGRQMAIRKVPRLPTSNPSRPILFRPRLYYNRCSGIHPSSVEPHDEAVAARRYHVTRTWTRNLPGTSRAASVIAIAAPRQRCSNVT